MDAKTASQLKEGDRLIDTNEPVPVQGSVMRIDGNYVVVAWDGWVGISGAMHCDVCRSHVARMGGIELVSVGAKK